MTDLCHLPAVELVRLMSQREVSCQEVVRAHLDRIEAVNPALNALVEPVDPDRCLAQAREADRRAADGRALGRMHGLPVAVKDVVQVAGLACSGGSPALRATADVDATVVSRLKADGAIVLGLTNVSELGRGGESDNPLYGRTNNPYDLTKTPGGSSGGSAALVAAGGAAFSVGQDGGGSIRQPAHFNGIAGLKPTNGRIPRTGSVFGDALGIFGPFPCYGPMARTAADLALGLSVLGGPDGRDPYTAPVPFEGPDAVDLSQLRVAFFLEDGISTPSDEVRSVVAAAALGLDGVASVVQVDPPPCLRRTMELLWETIFLGGDQGQGFERDLHRLGVGEPSGELAEFLRQARRIELSVTEVRSRLADLDAYRMEMLSFMAPFDVLLTPPAPTPAKDHGHGLNEIEDFSFLMAHNLTGWPAAVVRCGASGGGLPLGVQVVAKPWEDGTALAVAGHLEELFGGWHPPAMVAGTMG